MSKLEVFDYIERAAKALDDNLVGFSHAADKITEYLTSKFGDIDATIGVTARIKTRDSLKEKILRNNLYRETSPERLVFEMHDIIGVKIECRFFKDEAYLFDVLKELFCVDLGDGLFCPEGKKAIRLKLNTPQPEYQKNGYAIYRIDGNVTYANENYNFELQIKSLVNSFWSEIEHKLIYKNNRLNQFDNLMKQMLNYTHESLSGIDHQLNLIFNRMSGNAIVNQQEQLKNMLSLGLNEMFATIVKANTGISVGITEYIDAIVEYLTSASSYTDDMVGEDFIKTMTEKVVDAAHGDISATERARNIVLSDDNYGGLFISLMKWMREIDYNTISIGEDITLSAKFDGTYDEVAKLFLRDINNDFYLNTFFHIYFALERGTNDEDFADYIKYYTDTIMAGKTQHQIYRTLARLSELPANKLPLLDTMQMLKKIG
ncbi:MAG: hypothetical protein J1F69_05315 [Clostridiales bacterium]|nr:hypothetical protein [Clostridiales bacterium]